MEAGVDRRSRPVGRMTISRVPHIVGGGNLGSSTIHVGCFSILLEIVAMVVVQTTNAAEMNIVAVFCDVLYTYVGI